MNENYDNKNEGVSRAEQIALDALHKVQLGGEALVKAEKKRDKVLFLAVAIIIFMAIFFVWYATTAETRQAHIIKEFTQANREFDKDDAGWKGQKEKFRNLMMRAYRVYGKTYNKVDKRALADGTEKAQYINLCFDLSKNLGHPISEWHGPIISILESAINPYALGDFITIKAIEKSKKGKVKEVEKEVPTSYGMYQMKLSCAMHYYGYYLMLPEWFKKKHPITITCEEDLLNWRTSTILLYAGMWGLYTKEYMGEHAWTVTAHHFGSTALSRHFRQGNGHLPTYFIYNGVKYPVDEYWTAFLGMKEAFENGEIELGKPFRIKWDKVRKQIRAEEREFVKNFKTFKSFKKRIEELENSEKLKNTEIVSLKKDINNTYYKLVKNLGEQHEGKYKSVLTKFKEATGIVKDWMKKYNKDQKKKVIIQWVMFGGAVLISIAFQIFLLVLLLRWIKSKIKALKKWKRARKLNEPL